MSTNNEDINIDCAICGGKKFIISAGFYFCTECGTQSQDIRETEIDPFSNSQSQIKEKHKLKSTKDKNSTTSNPTTWEEYNYIIIGLVNELIEIGLPESLKLTTLQIWTAYLRNFEVAFYSKKDTKLPRFGAHYKIKDAEILYNRKKPNRRNSYASSTKSAGALSAKKEISKLRKSLMESEYAKYQESKDSLSLNLSNSICNKSSIYNSDDSQKSVDLQYSKYGVKTIKKQIRKHKKPIEKFDDTAEGFKSIKRRSIQRYSNYDTVTRQIVFVIICLAMNQINCEHQLSDIIRYIREGHLSYYEIGKFFPDNIDITNIQASFRQNVYSIPAYYHFRVDLTGIANLLKIQLQLPDISKLCKRYVEELELPLDVHRLIDVLISIYPPEMKFNRQQKIRSPNYEGRAMAYIVFILKFLFGLDDERDDSISQSAITINKTLETIDCKEQKSLFVWSEWVKYIEMRNVLLSKCHYPSALVIDPNCENNTYLYLEYLSKCSTTDETKYTVKHPKDIALMTNIHEIFKDISLSRTKDEHKRPSISFCPSITPQRSYLEYILKNHSASELSALHIPTFMQEKHYNRDIITFLRPSKLKSTLEKHDIGLICNENGYSKKLHFDQLLRGDDKIRGDTARKKININFDITEQKWLNNIEDKKEKCDKNDDKRSKIVEIIEKNLEKIYESNRNIKIDKERQSKIKPQTNINSQQQLTTNIEPSMNATSISDIFSMASNDYLDIVGTEFRDIIVEPRKNLDNTIETIFNYNDEEHDHEKTTNVPKNYSHQLTLEISNCDYWLTIGHMRTIDYSQFNEIFNKFPKSFQWLLKQCSQLIENEPRDLYEQLVILENCYAHVLEPFNTFSNNIVTFQNLDKYKNVNRLNRAIQTFVKHW